MSSVVGGIGVAHHRVVLEGAEDEQDGVAVAQRAEEGVAEPLAAARALHERGDVDDLEAGVDELLRVRHRAEEVDPLVGHVRDADGGLDGGEGVGGDDRRRPGQGVEEARLAAVRQAHESETFHARSLPAALCAIAVGAGRGSSTTLHRLHDSGCTRGDGEA